MRFIEGQVYRYGADCRALFPRSREHGECRAGHALRVALFHAPSTVTGSLLDQIASRGAASPLCSASSASWRRVRTHSKKSSRSLGRGCPRSAYQSHRARPDRWSTTTWGCSPH